MKPLRIPLRAVLYKEENVWVAHCLEFDLIGDGETQQQALASLSKAIVVQLEASLKYKNLGNLFRPADGRFFKMFAAGTNIAKGGMEIIPQSKSLEIEEVEAREYSESEELDDELVPA